MKRILHINCNYIGTSLHQIMMNHFEGKSVENAIFCPTYDPGLSIITPNDNVCVATCFKKWDRLLYKKKQSKIIKRVESEYEVSSFDCIHAYTLFTDGNVAYTLSRKYGVPYVVAVRDTDISTFLRYRPYLKNKALEIVKNATAVFFLSQPYKDRFTEKYVPESMRREILNKSRIIPNGIDDFWHENEFERCSDDKADRIRSQKIEIVYAGRINRRKNTIVTQKALQILRHKGWDVRFTYAGAIENPELQKQLIQFPDTNYMGKLNKQELSEMYRRADIFVMPSLTETFGLVYAEAMSQGLPVVYTRKQGFDKQFEEGVVGYSVDPKDPKDVARAIENIAADYQNIQSRVVCASRKFLWDDIVDEYCKIYASMG